MRTVSVILTTMLLFTLIAASFPTAPVQTSSPQILDVANPSSKEECHGLYSSSGNTGVFTTDLGAQNSGAVVGWVLPDLTVATFLKFSFEMSSGSLNGGNRDDALAGLVTRLYTLNFDGGSTPECGAFPLPNGETQANIGHGNYGYVSFDYGVVGIGALFQTFLGYPGQNVFEEYSIEIDYIAHTTTFFKGTSIVGSTPNVFQPKFAYFVSRTHDGNRALNQLRNLELTVEYGTCRPGNFVLFDDFSDGDYTGNPSWEVLSGSYAISSGAILNTAALYNIARVPSTKASGSWQWQTMRSSSTPPYGGFGTYFMTAGAYIVDTVYHMVTRLQSGYQVGVEDFSVGVYIKRLDPNPSYQSGTTDVILAVNPNYPASYFNDGNWHDWLVTRETDGHMRVWLDEILVLEATDNTYTTSSYFAIETYQNSAGERQEQWDNIRMGDCSITTTTTASTTTSTTPAPPGESAVVRYRGNHREAITIPQTPIGPGGFLVEQSVPTPPSVGGDPNFWLLERVNVDFWGLQISTDGGTTWGPPSFEQISTNIVAEGVHLVEADSATLTPGPIDYIFFLSNFDAAVGSTIRIKVHPASNPDVRFRFGGGGMVTRYRMSSQTLATIVGTTSDPSERIITMNLGDPAFTDLDPGFGTSGAFFNARLFAQVSWNFGRAVPTSLRGPGGGEVLKPTYTTDYTRFLYFDAQSAQIVIHSGGRGFYDVGVPVVGEWRLTVHIEDPNHLGSLNNMPQTIAPAGKVTALIEAPQRVVDSEPVTLAPGQSITYSPPTLGSGWYYEGLSAVHIVSQCNPGSDSNPECNVNLITTDGSSEGGYSGVDGADRIWWALYHTGITLTNPTSAAMNLKITYTVYYVADAVGKIPLSDTESVYDNTHMLHTFSMTLGSSMPDSGLALGFTSPYADIRIQHPSLDWRSASDVRTPAGTSADAIDGLLAFAHDYLADPYGVGYVGTWSVYQPNVALLYPWVSHGAAAAGTWTYEALEPREAPVCNPPTCNTPEGEDVQVDLGSGTQATFDQVTNGGVTTVTVNSTNPESPQANYQFLNSFYDIGTTATFSGPVTVCLTYHDSGIPSDREQTLQLFHWNGTAWVEVTTSLDTANNVICGQSATLSPFAIGYQLYVFGGFLQPINTDGSSIFKLGSTVPVKFQLKDVQGSFVTNAVAKIYVAKISSNVVGSEIEAVSTAAATSGNTFRYDSSTNQYIFNLSTKNLSSGTWQIRILLSDGTSQYVVISLR